MALQDQVQDAIPRETVLSLFDGRLRERMEAMAPELTEASQAEIEKMRKPNEIDYKLREKLWFLIENAQKTRIPHIPTVRVFEGILTEQGFQLAIENPLRLAWMMLRPTEDRSKMRTVLTQLIQKIETEVLPRAITDDNMGNFLKLLEFLTNRVHGPVIQKIEAKHAHVNLNKQLASAAPDDQQRRLGALKEKLLQAKDVTPGGSTGDAT